MKPGLKTLIAGVLFFILGGIVIPVFLIFSLFFNESSNHQFLVPGAQEVTVSEVGRHYLWNDYQTIYGGKSFSRSEDIPDGLEITVADESGKVLAFIGDTSTSFSSGNNSKNSIGYVEVGDPGKLLVFVSGNFEERVFSFSQSLFMKRFLTTIGGGLLAFLLAFTGLGLGVWGIVKLIRNKTEKQQIANSAPLTKNDESCDISDKH